MKEDGTDITYTYGPDGNRISKTVVKTSPATTETTWYVRDAQGNVMSVYESGKTALNDGHLTQSELHLYGSSRLGLLHRSLDVAGTYNSAETNMPLLGSGISVIFDRGDKLFELSNHLGNVLVTLNDKKLGVSSNNNTVDYFNPQVVSAQDYYPFGMLQPERSMNTGGYRYGFNGKENDNEVKGEGNQQDYGMRVYDTRLGRFLSVDPLTKDYPWYTPYQFAGNSPNSNIDLDGAEPKPSIKGTQETQSQQTSEETYNMRGDYTGLKQRTWYWHAGGLRTANGGVTKADWYGSEDYVNTLSTSLAAKSLGSSLGLYNAAAKSLGGDNEYAKSELTKFVGNGLSNEAAKYMIAAAKATANSSNSFASGKIEPSSFYVEDLLGVGMLLKEGVKFLGGLAARNGGMALVGFGSDKAILENTANLIPKRGWFDVVVHGTEDGMAFTMNKKAISPQQLYNYMLENGYKPGTKIRLMSCYSGNFPNGAAAQLQKIAGAQVVAPTGELSIFNKGSFMVNYGQQFYIAPTPENEVGRMLLFK